MNNIHYINNIKKNTLTSLSHLGFILVSGPEAGSFLQGQLTCDVYTQNLGGYCNIQGRLISLFRLWRLPETFGALSGFCLECPLEILESTLTTLKKYALFSKVTIQNVSNQLYTLGLFGHHLTAPISPHSTILINAIQCIDSINRYEIISSDLNVVTELKKQYTDFHQGTPEQWQILDILAKIPQITPKTQGEFLPHNINLPLLGGVSFTKGCYLGQEIIARMEYRAKIKKQLTLLNSDEYPSLQPGDPIYAQSETIIGHVVNRVDPFILASCEETKSHPE